MLMVADDCWVSTDVMASLLEVTVQILKLEIQIGGYRFYIRCIYPEQDLAHKKYIDYKNNRKTQHMTAPTLLDEA